jgi:PAS domain S-box-containing protein
MAGAREWAGNLPLSIRVAFSVVIVVVLTLAVFGFVANREVESVVVPAELDRLSGHALSLANQLDDGVRDARADVITARSTPPVAGILRARLANGVDPLDHSTEVQWRDRLTEYFSSILAAHPEFLQLRLIDAAEGGREIVRVDRARAGEPPRVVAASDLQPKGDRPYFEATMKLAPGQIYVSPIELNQEFGRVEVPHIPVVRVGAVVRGHDSKAMAAVVLNIDMRPNLSRISKGLYADGQVYVVDASGDYLLHPDSGREFGAELGHASRAADDWPGISFPTDTGAVSTSILERKSGKREAVAVASRRLAGAVPILVIETAPYDAVARPATVLSWAMTLGGISAAAVAIMVTILVTRTLIGPLNRMAVAIDRARGDEPLALPAGGGREMGALRRAFVRMNDDVRARTDALRAEIAEREKTQEELKRYAEAARMHAAVVESSNDAIVTETLDGVVTGWNKGAEALLGYSADEIIGKNIDVMIPEPFRADAHAMLAEVGQGRSVAHHETIRRTKDERQLDVSISVSPIRSETGEIIGAAKIARDVTARRMAEERFRLVFDAASAGMIMADRSGRIVLANTEAARLFGYENGELINKQVEILVPAGIRLEHRNYRTSFQTAPEKRAMGGGRDLAGIRKDGTEIPVEIGLNPLQTRNGLMVLAVIVDLTERKRAASRLAEQSAELQRSNDELEQFAYVASHDLQEPLRMVASYTELLAERYRGQLDERADKYIRYAIEGAGRMQRLVADLLAYSRVGSQAKPLRSTDSRAVLDGVLRVMRATIAESGGNIECGNLPLVMADDGQLALVFQNLIGNALKFHGDAQPLVRIGAERSGDDWIFSIADNGIGIDKAHVDDIFQMFRRLHTREKYDGNGIGLTIAKRIVERHGGLIWLTSTPGQGATFYFTMHAA